MLVTPIGFLVLIIIVFAVLLTVFGGRLDAGIRKGLWWCVIVAIALLLFYMVFPVLQNLGGVEIRRDVD
jgi:purine-cytosine permease-like protein